MRWEQGNSPGVQGSTGGVERGPGINQMCPSCALLHRQHGIRDCVGSPDGQSQVQATVCNGSSEVSQKGCLLWAGASAGVRAGPCHGLADAAAELGQGWGRGQGHDAPQCLEAALRHGPGHQKQLSSTVTTAARCWPCSRACAGRVSAVCFLPWRWTRLLLARARRRQRFHFPGVCSLSSQSFPRRRAEPLVCRV